MKVVALVVVFVMLASGLALANNSARIKELNEEAQKLVSQIQQAQEFIVQKQAEILKLQGAVEELSRLDKEATGEDKKEDKKKK